MKSVVKIFLAIWFSFLSAPTIISLVESDSSKYIVSYSMSEEESHKETKPNSFEESPEEYLIFTNHFYSNYAKKSQKIKLDHEIKHDPVFEEIFSPPPEVV